MRNKKTIRIYGIHLFISYPTRDMITLRSKGNGKNYYGFDSSGVHEIVKIKGAFYRTAYKNGALIPVGDAIPRSHLILPN